MINNDYAFSQLLSRAMFVQIVPLLVNNDYVPLVKRNDQGELA